MKRKEKCSGIWRVGKAGKKGFLSWNTIEHPCMQMGLDQQKWKIDNAEERGGEKSGLMYLNRQEPSLNLRKKKKSEKTES